MKRLDTLLDGWPGYLLGLACLLILLGVAAALAITLLWPALWLLLP